MGIKDKAQRIQNKGLIHTYIYLFIHSFIHSFIYLYIHLYIYTFIHSYSIYSHQLQSFPHFLPIIHTISFYKPTLIMTIHNSHHLTVKHRQYKKTPFYDLFQADEDLLQQLISLINSLFNPLTWILEETLYRKIHKQDKGWININFLHRNPTFQTIFKKYQILSHSRRRNKFINKAISQSIIKRKRNLIKRKQHLKISHHVKKIIYLQLKTSQLNAKNIMREKVLRQIIGESVKAIIQARIQQQSFDKLQIQGEDKSHLDLSTILSSIVFEGLLREQAPEQQSTNNLQNENMAIQSVMQKEISYQWCFIYFPSLQEHEVNRIRLDLQNIVESQKEHDKIQLQQSMQKLNITEESISKVQLFNESKLINIYPLQRLISIYYPKYCEICEQIGYSRVDYRKQALRTKQKLRQKQKVRLLQSRFIDDKIDLVNEYHLKLQILKQKRVYWQKRNKQIEQKVRRRQQRRKNRLNKNESTQLKTDLTSKLKRLFNIDQPPKLKVQERSFEAPSQSIKQNSIKGEKISQEPIQESIESDIEANGPGFKIIIPQYKSSESNLSEFEPESQKFKKQEPPQDSNMSKLYESENQEIYDDISSSGEEFQLPKKKKKNDSSQKSKHKKIVKPVQNSNTPKSKHQNRKNSGSKSAKNVAQFSLKSLNGNSQSHSNGKRNSQSSNGSYNLRHKSPSQGSYLRMAGYVYQEDYSYRQKQKKNIYEDDEDERQDQSSNSRSMRPRRS